MRNPPAQHSAATNPAFRGPSVSTQRPNSAADEPRKKIPSVNVIVSVLTFQSPGAECVMPIALLSGSQNTLNPYAMPIDRWIASAAGGTVHRLNSGDAMMRSFERREADETEVAVFVTWSRALDVYRC